LVVFELLHEARSGAHLAEAGEFDDELAGRAGHLVGALHESSLMARCAWPDPPAATLIPAMRSLSWEQFRSATGAELQLWRILQQDRQLGSAVRRLLHQRPDPSTPVHCDLRLDQFLVSADRLYLADWEELRIADPARDVGSFAGEWLFRSIIELANGSAAATERTGPSHEDIVDRAVLAFEQVRPRIAAFWAGYLAARSSPDGGLSTRATAYAGWHQFDRLFAIARDRPRLGPAELAIAGIGRQAVLSPNAFADALGLVGTP
jgi:predicted trehalose synthase